MILRTKTHFRNRSNQTAEIQVKVEKAPKAANNNNKLNKYHVFSLIVNTSLLFWMFD